MASLEVEPRSQPFADRMARVLTEVFAPAVLVAVLILLSSFIRAGFQAGLPFALVAVFFIAVLPFAVVVYLTRRGKLTDHHISRRSQRAPVLGGAIVSVLVGVGILSAMGAPAELMIMIASILAGIITVLAVNLVWKLSAHTAVAVFFAAALIIYFGPWGLLAAVIPVGVGWSRVRLEAHTVAQVLAGGFVGLLIGFGFSLLSP